MSKRNLIPEAKAALDQLKYEIADEVGIPIKNNDFSKMTSYQNGYMVKKMIDDQIKQIAEKNHNEIL